MHSSASNPRNLNLIISAVAGLVIVFILFIRLNKDIRPPKFSSQIVNLDGLEFDVQVRSEFQRTWVDPGLRLFEEASSIASGEVFQPYIIRAIPDLGFAVFDFGDKKVKVFLNDGSLSAVLGGGFGEGPSEFLGATDMYVEDSDVIHVMDAKQSRLTSLRLHSGETSSIQIRGSMVYRIAADASGRVLGYRLYGESMLGWIADDGSITSLPEIVPVSNPRDWVIMDGDLHWTGESFVLSPKFFPILIELDEEGQFKRATSTMEYPMSQAATIEYMGQSVSTKNNQALRLSTTLLKNELLALSEAGDTLGMPGDASRVVDRYRMPGGTYISSFTIPKECSRIAANDEWLYCTTGNQLRIFQFGSP